MTDRESPRREWPLWEVFIRSAHGLAHKHVGSLHAADAPMALTNARDVYTRRGEGLSIWVVRSSDIVAMQPEDRAPFLESADGKPFRHATHYDVAAGLENI